MEKEKRIKLSKHAAQISLKRYIGEHYSTDSQRFDLQNIQYWTNRLLLTNGKSTSSEIQRLCYKWALLILDGPSRIKGLLAIVDGETKRAYESIVIANIRIIWKQRCEQRFLEILKEIDDGKRYTTTPALNEIKAYNFPLFPDPKDL